MPLALTLLTATTMRPGRVLLVAGIICQLATLAAMAQIDAPAQPPRPPAPPADSPALAPAPPAPAPPAPAPAVASPVPQAAPVLEDILSYADLLYSKEQFALAAQQYQIFIREQPNSPNLQAAWFRLGECYLKVNQLEDSTTTFNYLINTYRRGVFVGSAAYRLAVLRFNEKDYRNALAYFKVAKDELTNPEAVVQARFYYARCLQLTAQGKEALTEFEAVMASS